VKKDGLFRLIAYIDDYFKYQTEKIQQKMVAKYFCHSKDENKTDA